MAQDAIINRWDINGDVYDIQDAGRGRPLGVATLDENGRVPYTQLPESAIEFKGYWDASTNTPHLQDGTGTKGDLYYVDIAGTQDLGSGAQEFYVGDRVLYDGSIWKNIATNTPDVDNAVGVLAVDHGGTGQTSQLEVNKAIIAELTEDSSDVTDGTMFVSSNATDNGFAETNDGGPNKPYKRKFIAVWNYIKSKISSVLGLNASTYGGASLRVQGIYTGSGGQQNPQYVGKGAVRFNMMNTSVLSDSSYKNWLLMDCYSGFDVGGVTALGLSRTQLRAYVMRSDAGTSPNRPTSWAQGGEIPIIVTKTNDVNKGIIVFSNGLKIQWGMKATNTDSITFWTAFSTSSSYTFNFIAIRSSSTSDAWHYCHSSTTTGIKVMSRSENAMWIAIGF